MEASEWDHATLREEEFEQHAVYLVPDVAASPADANRAEASLPRNLVLKPSQALNDVRSSAKESYLETPLVRATSSAASLAAHSPRVTPRSIARCKLAQSHAMEPTTSGAGNRDLSKPGCQVAEMRQFRHLDGSIIVNSIANNASIPRDATSATANKDLIVIKAR